MQAWDWTQSMCLLDKQYIHGYSQFWGIRFLMPIECRCTRPIFQFREICRYIHVFIKTGEQCGGLLLEFDVPDDWIITPGHAHNDVQSSLNSDNQISEEFISHCFEIKVPVLGISIGHPWRSLSTNVKWKNSSKYHNFLIFWHTLYL